MAVPASIYISLHSLLKQKSSLLLSNITYFGKDIILFPVDWICTPVECLHNSPYCLVWRALSANLCPSHGTCICFAFPLLCGLEPARSLLQKRNSLSLLRWMSPITSAAWHQAKIPLGQQRENSPSEGWFILPLLGNKAGKFLNRCKYRICTVKTLFMSLAVFICEVFSEAQSRKTQSLLKKFSFWLVWPLEEGTKGKKGGSFIHPDSWRKDGVKIKTYRLFESLKQLTIL